LRRLCLHCREPVSPTDEELALFDAHGLDAPSQVFRPRGCEHCSGRGYWGRVGAFEAICFDEQLKEAVSSGASENTLRNMLRSSGAASLLDHALAMARDGVTAVAEALAMCTLNRSEAPQGTTRQAS
jgi:general secretion pathway protein E